MCRKGSAVYNGIGVVKRNFTVGVAVGIFSRLSPCAIRIGLIPTKARLVESHGGPLGFHHSSMRSRSALYITGGGHHDSPFDLPAVVRGGPAPNQSFGSAVGGTTALLGLPDM